MLHVISSLHGHPPREGHDIADMWNKVTTFSPFAMHWC